MNSLRKELAIYLRDGRVGLLLLALGGLFLAAALMTGWQQHSYRTAGIRAAQTEYARWLGQPKKYAHSAAHYGMWAFKTPTPLAGMDPGITAHVGSAVWMEAHLQNELLYRPAQDAGVSERFGSLSPAVVIGAFAPLMLLLMGFGAVARERETGTWTLSLVQGRSVARLVWAKAAVLAGLALLALIPGLIAIVAFVQAASSPSSDTWLRLALWLLGATVYLTTVAVLIVALSLWVRGSARVLGVGLAIWVVAVVLVPRFANGVAASVAPLQTQQEFSRDLKTTLAAPDLEGARRLEELAQRLMRQNEVDDVAKLPVNLAGTRIQMGEEHSNVVYDRKWTSLFDSIDKQRGLARTAGLVSPLIAFNSLSQTVTGSDFTQHRAFVVQVEDHRRMMQRLMNAEIERHPEMNGQRHQSDESVWRTVPPFQFQLPRLSSLGGQWWPSLLVMSGWLLLAAFVLTALARREARRRA
jgi:ABC-2 type transport system permease protein